MTSYFEDIPVGVTVDLGAHTFTADEIVDFATKFDPQPFHLSEEGAKGTLFAGLCASGWHTAAVWLRHVLDFRRREAEIAAFRGETAAQYGPSPGFENIRWLRPVYAGDTVRFATKVVEKIDSRSRPTIGLLVSDNEGVNQDGTLVFQVRTKIFVERRRAYQPA